jgi:hypothetical protein
MSRLCCISITKFVVETDTNPEETDFRNRRRNRSATLIVPATNKITEEVCTPKACFKCRAGLLVRSWLMAELDIQGWK